MQNLIEKIANEQRKVDEAKTTMDESLYKSYKLQARNVCERYPYIVDNSCLADANNLLLNFILSLSRDRYLSDVDRTNIIHYLYTNLGFDLSEDID